MTDGDDLERRLAAADRRLAALEAAVGELRELDVVQRAFAARDHGARQAADLRAAGQPAEAARHELVCRAEAAGYVRVRPRGRTKIVVPTLHPRGSCKVLLAPGQICNCAVWLDAKYGPVLVDVAPAAWADMLAKHPAIAEALRKGELSVEPTPLDDVIRKLRDEAAAPVGGHAA